MTNSSNPISTASLHSTNTTKPPDLYKTGVGVCRWLLLEDTGHCQKWKTNCHKARIDASKGDTST